MPRRGGPPDLSEPITLRIVGTDRAEIRCGRRLILRETTIDQATRLAERTAETTGRKLWVDASAVEHRQVSAPVAAPAPVATDEPDDEPEE